MGSSSPVFRMPGHPLGHVGITRQFRQSAGLAYGTLSAPGPRVPNLCPMSAACRTGPAQARCIHLRPCCPDAHRRRPTRCPGRWREGQRSARRAPRRAHVHHRTVRPADRDSWDPQAERPADLGQPARRSACTPVRGRRGRRLQLSGGSFPEYDRNLGTGQAPATGTATATATHVIDHATTTLSLPVGPPA